MAVTGVWYHTDTAAVTGCVRRALRPRAACAGRARDRAHHVRDALHPQAEHEAPLIDDGVVCSARSSMVIKAKEAHRTVQGVTMSAALLTRIAREQGNQLAIQQYHMVMTYSSMKLAGDRLSRVNKRVKTISRFVRRRGRCRSAVARRGRREGQKNRPVPSGGPGAPSRP